MHNEISTDKQFLYLFYNSVWGILQCIYSGILKCALWLLTLSLILFMLKDTYLIFIYSIYCFNKSQTNTCIDVFISILRVHVHL